MSDAPEVEEVPIDRLTRVFIKMRDKRSAMKKAFDAEYDALGEQMDAVKSLMLDYMQEQKLDSVRTSEGLVYRTVQKRYWTNDWEAMGRFIIDRGLPEFFEKRLNQGVVQQFLEAHPDVIPPGLNTNSEYVVTVKRPT